MSLKKTHRKGFNFFRSYYDVFNELPEKDRLSFITALLNKQFLGEEPKDLKGMSKFAWISQQHSISEQVKGYETKTKTKLTPTIGGVDTPTEQVQVQVQGKVQCSIDWSKLLSKFNDITGKSSRVVPDKARNQILARIKEGYTKADILKGIENCYKDSHHQETNHKYLTLEFISRPDKLEKFVNVTPIAQKKAPQYKDDWR
jgi:uncharacterized phage protein (TIGR02220 family)